MHTDSTLLWSAVSRCWAKQPCRSRGSTHERQIIFALCDIYRWWISSCALSIKKATRPFARLFTKLPSFHRATCGGSYDIVGQSRSFPYYDHVSIPCLCVHSKLSRYRGGTTPSLPTYLRRRAYIGYDDGTIRWFRVDRNLDLFVFDLANDVGYRSLSAHTPPRSSYLSTLPGRIQCIAFEKGIDLLG